MGPLRKNSRQEGCGEYFFDQAQAAPKGKKKRMAYKLCHIYLKRTDNHRKRQEAHHKRRQRERLVKYNAKKARECQVNQNQQEEQLRRQQDRNSQQRHRDQMKQKEEHKLIWMDKRSAHNPDTDYEGHIFLPAPVDEDTLIWDPIKCQLVPRVPEKACFPSVVLPLYDPKKDETLESTDQAHPEIVFKDVNQPPVSWNIPTKFGMIISPPRLDQNVSATLGLCDFRPPSPAETEFMLHIVEEPLCSSPKSDQVNNNKHFSRSVTPTGKEVESEDSVVLQDNTNILESTKSQSIGEKNVSPLNSLAVMADLALKPVVVINALDILAAEIHFSNTLRPISPFRDEEKVLTDDSSDSSSESSSGDSSSSDSESDSEDDFEDQFPYLRHLRSPSPLIYEDFATELDIDEACQQAGQMLELFGTPGSN